MTSGLYVADHIAIRSSEEASQFTYVSGLPARLLDREYGRRHACGLKFHGTGAKPRQDFIHPFSTHARRRPSNAQRSDRQLGGPPYNWNRHGCRTDRVAVLHARKSFLSGQLKRCQQLGIARWRIGSNARSIEFIPVD